MMNNFDNWGNDAGEFLNNLFTEVSKGLEKAARKLEKEYPDDFEFDFLKNRNFWESPRRNRPEEGPKAETSEATAENDAPKPEGPRPVCSPRSNGMHPRRPHDARPTDGRFFPADVIDYGETLEIAASLPGFKKSDMKVSLKGEELTIKATRDWREVENQEKYLTVEQRYGNFERTFQVGKVDADSVRAVYTDGILHVSLIKTPEPEGASITIE